MADQQVRANVVRRCDVCAQSDDHPRHVVYRSIADPSFPGKYIDIGSVRHMDCCAAAGCEHDGSCDVIMSHVAAHGDKAKFVKGEQRLTGDDLRAHIQKHGDELAAQHEAATIERMRAEHGSDRVDRYLAGGHLYEQHEVEAMREKNVTTHRQLQEATR